ncbi:DUF305 domain-containing protein [Arthrobacter sp. G119Y2]|uniref:DUF305 domain-containing protein n=1 Tax=Arthrobacter sp. G119Y2 TaxID=3134965 RepID=UPI00311986FA
MKRHTSQPPHALSALALAAALVLAGCGQSGTGDAASGSADSSAAETAAPDSAAANHNDADTIFAQMMIPHHQQAVEMSNMMLAKDGLSPEIVDLASGIKDAQGPEIETMTRWLESWGEPAEPADGMQGHQHTGSVDTMEGMLSEEQLSRLKEARGADASRMFLESMTAHHEGAVSMARDELEGGRNPEALELAGTVISTQQAEITEMGKLLAAL